METDIHSTRENLYGIIQHYAELAQAARRGEADPLAKVGRIVKNRYPYLVVVIRDLLPLLERGELTYHEVVFNILREAQRFNDQKVLIESKSEVERIEAENRVFIFAVKWLDSSQLVKPGPEDFQLIKKMLGDFNRKYKERYAPEEDETTTLIPFFVPVDSADSHETGLLRTAELVRRALLELHHLMIENEPQKRFLIFSKSGRKEIEEDIWKLAWFLFRCGFSVDRISSGYFKDLISAFLNEKILQYLIETEKNVQTLLGVSMHLYLMSLIDFGSFYERPNDYIDLEDPKEVARQVKHLKNKNRAGSSLLAKTLELLKFYEARPQGQLVRSFLQYRYYAAHGDYYGDRHHHDPRGELAVEVYQPLLDRSAMDELTKQELATSGKAFSSKTQDEMAGLINLILDSLENPEKVRGAKVKILGDISSGAMGKVSIGIWENRIVALKVVKQGVATSLGDPVALLEYEAAMNERVQPPVKSPDEQYPYIVEYHGMVVQDGETIIINGYHPNDCLTQLVERNWHEKYKPPFQMQSRLNLANLEIILNQLLDCLRRFREKGLVHRDLKTDNILYMVDENDQVNQVKVIDFGVARAVGDGAKEDIFKGKVVGTFSYMAPEQARGNSVFASDLYSVGAIFTVLLTGKLPMVFPKTQTRQELAKQILRIEREPRPRLTKLNPWLRKNVTLEHIAATTERMLDLDPHRRPTLEEVQEAFDGVFEHIGDEKHTISVFYHKG